MKQNCGRVLFLLSGLLGSAAHAAGAPALNPSSVSRNLYAVSQSADARGSISVYDIDGGHRLIKTIKTVPSVGDVRGSGRQRRHRETVRRLPGMSRASG